MQEKLEKLEKTKSMHVYFIKSIFFLKLCYIMDHFADFLPSKKTQPLSDSQIKSISK